MRNPTVLRHLGYALVLLLATLNTHAATDDYLCLSDDWSVDARQARSAGLPIMMIFSSDECIYCERLKQEVLSPMLQRDAFTGKVLIREIYIDSGGKVTDFDGERIRRRSFVNRYHVYATPTVVLVDFQGAPLVEPIVGYNNASSYSDSLDEAVSTALFSLTSISQPRLAHK